MTLRLGQLPVAARLAIACFVLLLLAFHLTAQANLWVHDGGGKPPGPADVLGKYHGRDDDSRLHRVLDPDLPPSDPHAMWVYLDPASNPVEIDRRRLVILAWVEQGAPETGWPAVKTVLHAEAACLQCHAFGAERQDLPFESYDQVLVVARGGGGMPLASLLVSAHNHAFAFAVMALLLALGTAFTGLPISLKAILTLAAFGGAALDVGSWFLTRAYGAPWHWGVLVGGAAFGLATALMCVVVLLEVSRPRGDGEANR